MTSEAPPAAPVGVGVIGLGRGFVLMAPGLSADPRLRLVAAAAPRAASRAAFEAAFGGTTYEDADSLCADPAVEIVYVATPHALHRAHVEAAARAGKHVLVDKPIAIALDDAAAMVAACRRAGVQLIAGPSHSFDPPVATACALIASGETGPVQMVQALNYTDFLYRPRRPEELVTAAGGGVVFSQAIHQIDVIRRLVAAPARQVQAMTGAWDPDRPTEGAYSALIGFEGGAFAALTYSGYAHFDSDIWMGWTGELGQAKDPAAYGAARRALAAAPTPEAETALKTARTFGGKVAPQPTESHEHFGPVIVSCRDAALRLTPTGVELSGNRARRFVPAPPVATPRKPVIDAIVAAVRQARAPVQTGAWGLASLEICHALLEAARSGQPVRLTRQTEEPAR